MCAEKERISGMMCYEEAKEGSILQHLDLVVKGLLEANTLEI